MFTPQELNASDAALSWPLVSCRYPGLTLPRWAEFVRDQNRRGSCARLIGLIDTRGRIHAIFGYALERPRELQVTHIATFRLAGNAIYRAFDRTIERLARENDCREISIVPWTGIEPGDGPVILSEDVAVGRRILSMDGATESADVLH